MSEQLKDFGARAESLVEIPDFTELDRRGQSLRVRRRVGVAAALAVVLTVAGVAVSHHRDKLDSGPVTPHGKTLPYPGATMKNLEAGTYGIHPSRIETDLVAELTLPAGWNSWVGPNRFDGHAPGASNNQALGRMTWYVGALAVEVEQVNTQDCFGPGVRVLETPQQVVNALRRAFATEVVQEPTQVQRFGRSGTHLRLRVTPEVDRCPDGREPNIFYTTANGYLGYAPAGTLLDIWVLDVEGTTIYVQRAWTPNAPASARGQLDGVIDSLRFKTGG